MKKFFTLISALIVGCIVYGQTDTVYMSTYGGIQNDVCNQIKATNDGGYIMIGTSNSFGCGNTDFYAVKIDSVGKHEWSKTFGGTENEGGFSVTQTFDHGFAFLGFTDSYGAGGYDVYLVKTDSMGNFQWQRTYGGSDWDFGYSIQQVSDSGFVICGQTYSYGAGNGDVYVIRTNKNGDTLWTRAIGGTGYDVGNSVAVENDSLYAIVGNTTSFGYGDTNIYFILMNNKGIIKKDTTYGCAHINMGNSIRTTLDHGFVIYGSTDCDMPGKPDEVMIKTDSVGNMQFIYIYVTTGIGLGKDALQEPDGTYVSIGINSSDGYGPFAMHMQHLGAGGWFISGLGAGGSSYQQGNSASIGKNGNVVFAGASNSPGFTNGLYDIMIARWLNADSIKNIRYNDTINFYDTSYCTLGVANQPVLHPQIKIFPNPVSSSSNILVQGGVESHYSFNVYNGSGECIIHKMPLQSIDHAQSSGHFERGDLAAGIYICQILNQSGVAVATCKFIVE